VRYVERGLDEVLLVRKRSLALLGAGRLSSL
jgi:hypothetical protein